MIGTSAVEQLNDFDFYYNYVRYYPRRHEAVTCMKPISGIECMKGEGGCVSNMQQVTVYYDQKNLGVDANITDMVTTKMAISKSCLCRIIKKSDFCIFVSYELDETCMN